MVVSAVRNENNALLVLWMIYCIVWSQGAQVGWSTYVSSPQERRPLVNCIHTHTNTHTYSKGHLCSFIRWNSGGSHSNKSKLNYTQKTYMHTQTPGLCVQMRDCLSVCLWEGCWRTVPFAVPRVPWTLNAAPFTGLPAHFCVGHKHQTQAATKRNHEPARKLYLGYVRLYGACFWIRVLQDKGHTRQSSQAANSLFPEKSSIKWKSTPVSNRQRALTSDCSVPRCCLACASMV